MKSPSKCEKSVSKQRARRSGRFCNVDFYPGMEYAIRYDAGWSNIRFTLRVKASG